MGLLRIAVFLLAAAPGSAGAGAGSHVRDAETGFAKAFADRDQARFFSYVAEDATFLSPKKTMNGKAQVVEGRRSSGVRTRRFAGSPSGS